MASSSDSSYDCGKSLLDDLDTGLRAKRRWRMAFLALRAVHVMLELPKEIVSRTKKYGDDETGRYSFAADVYDREDAGLAEIVREKNSAATQRPKKNMASSSDLSYDCGRSLLHDLDTVLRAKRRWRMTFLALRFVHVMLELPKEIVSRTKKYGDDETSRYSFAADVDDHEDAELADTVREKNSAATQRHQLLPPETKHVTGALEYEHLIAQVFNSSQSGAKGFSCHDHGTINIAYRWENFICVGVDSKLTNALTGHVTDLSCNKFYQLSRNIYITMAGFRMAWEEMWQWITSVFLIISEELHTVELAANLAYHFVSPYHPVCSLVLGWDITSPHPQMFRVISGISLTSDSAMAVGTGEGHINLRDLTNYDYGELAHAFHNTMLLLNQACRLDPFCGGIVIGRVLQRNQPPSCHYRNFFY